MVKSERLASNVIALLSDFSFLSGSSDVEEDEEMETLGYHADITIAEDMTYNVAETWDVEFLTKKHGIYRTIAKKGIFDDSVHNKDVSYEVQVSGVSCNVEYTESVESGNCVLKLGSEDTTLSGENTYEIAYSWHPMFYEEDADFSLAYYDLTPNKWQNSIPSGSVITVTFPKDFDHSKLRLYYGEAGSTISADNVAEMSWQGNTLTVTVTRDLELGKGITMWSNMGEGYFTPDTSLGSSEVERSASVEPFTIGMMIGSLILLAVLLLVYFIFGKDKKIVPNFNPNMSDDLDSACVSYIVDGVTGSRDILSLIYYWASKGYIVIDDTEGTITRTEKPLPSDAPYHQEYFFKELFASTTYNKQELREEIETDRLEESDIFYIVSICGRFVKSYIEKRGGVYTLPSVIIQKIATLIVFLPALILIFWTRTLTLSGVMGIFKLESLASFLLIICGTLQLYCAANERSKGDEVGIVYSYGATVIGVVILTGAYYLNFKSLSLVDVIFIFVTLVCMEIGILICAFMKKRTNVCSEWLESILGLKEFIETSDPEEFKKIKKENPNWFYDIYAYARVMGLVGELSDIIEKYHIPCNVNWFKSKSKNELTTLNTNNIRRLSMITNRACRQIYDRSRQIYDRTSNSSFDSGSNIDIGGGGGGGGGSW